MRALRVVGYDEQGVVILEDPDRRERFTVAADERLRAAARGDVLRLGQMSMELESQLRPREIQARIRAGASVEQVATAAGVPLQRIERFAYPVLLERSRTAEVAQQAHPVREDGPDLRTLGEVVAHTFGLRGQEYKHAEWDSWRGEDHKWVVALSWRVGHSDITAHWVYHPGAHGGTVTALDEHAADLVNGHLTRPPRPVGPVIDLTKPEPSSEQAIEPAKHAATDQPASGTPIAQAEHGTQNRAEVSPSAGKTTSPPQPDTADTRDTPATSGAKRGGRKGKPVMPSWEDVLLGVKSQRS